MDKSSNLTLPSGSLSSATTSKPLARPSPGQDDAVPQKRTRPDTTPEGASVLPLVSPERDKLTDDDHKSLDASILEDLSANVKHDEMPKLSWLLVVISSDMLKPLRRGEAEELLKREPRIAGILTEAWKARSFKKVRQLGVFPVQNTFTID
jgi:hypothetical protein